MWEISRAGSRDAVEENERKGLKDPRDVVKKKNRLNVGTEGRVRSLCLDSLLAMQRTADVFVLEFVLSLVGVAPSEAQEGTSSSDAKKQGRVHLPP